MVKKFTLTVKDYEYDLISKWKADFNLSSIFRDAIMEKIEAKERIGKEMADKITISDVIERLKKEKAAEEVYFYQIGVQDAINWMSIAKYRELTYLETWNIPYDEDEIDTKKLINDHVLGDYFKQMLTLHSKMAPSLESKYLNSYAKAWLKTWVESVMQYWNDIKGKI